MKSTEIKNRYAAARYGRLSSWLSSSEGRAFMKASQANGDAFSRAMQRANQSKRHIDECCTI